MPKKKSRKKTNDTTRKKTNDTKGTYLLIRGIPPDIKSQFKADCATKNISMHDAVLNFMKGVCA